MLVKKILALFEARDSRPSRAKSKDSADGFQDAEMSDEVYNLRRQVIDIIYKAHKIDATLPRIRVRVGSAAGRSRLDGSVLGLASVNNDTIWIDVKAVNITNSSLEQVVLHEIIHASYGALHVEEKNDIMNPYTSDANSKNVWKDFEKWHNRFKANKISKDGYIDELGKKHNWFKK